MRSSNNEVLVHALVGAGRWGSWLAWRLHLLGHKLVAVVGDRDSGLHLATRLDCPQVSELSDLPDLESTLVWLCLPDALLEGFAEANKYELSASAGVIHASGSAELLSGGFPSAACWPIQSITREQEPDWENLPFVIEANTPAFAKTVADLAARIGDGHPQVVMATADRRKLHLAATLTQNFSNLLWMIAAELLEDADLDYRSLLSLAENHIQKLASFPPTALQTGPARRNDSSTLRQHEAILSNQPVVLDLYQRLTRAIQERYSEADLDAPSPA